MPFSKILIAVDSSTFSMNAAKKGFELARQLNAEIAAVYVVDSARAIANLDAGILPMDTEEIYQKEGELTMKQLGEIFEGPGELVHFLPEGNPQEEIINTSEQWGADLIVIGTHGRTGLAHFLVGSIAESVVRHSKVPVMVVPTKDQDEE